MLDGVTTTAPAGEEGGAPAGTAPATTEDPTAKAIADARLRQGGAEKARQEAERLLAVANSQIEALKAGKTVDPSTDVAAIIKQALADQRAEFDKTLSDAKSAAQGEALDARFPVARKKFPAITDPIQLAELEGVFGEQTELPTPVGNSPARGAAGAGTKNIEDMSSKELQAYMASLDPSAAGLKTE